MLSSARLGAAIWRAAPSTHVLTRQPPIYRRALSAATSSTDVKNYGGMELTFLGTSSQGGARRFPSCMAMRLRTTARSEVWLFDVGEGSISQLQRSALRTSLVRNIFITHMHGDHLFGLPGLVLSILSSDQSSGFSAPAPGSGFHHDNVQSQLNVYGPQGIRAFLRTALGVSGCRIPKRNCLRIHELIWPEQFGTPVLNARHRSTKSYRNSAVRKLPYEAPSRDILPQRLEKNSDKYLYKLTEQDAEVYESTSENGSQSPKMAPQKDRDSIIARGPAAVVAAPVLHTVPCYAYGVTENVVQHRFDKEKLKEMGVVSGERQEVRNLFKNWLVGKPGVWQGETIPFEDVMLEGRQARRVCVVGDTYDAEGASHIAEDVDVLVHEATNVAAQNQQARLRGHSSTVGATAFAKKVRAKRLIMNHTSVSYSELKIRGMETEARAMYGGDRTFVARDLSVFSVPTCEEDGKEFVFRRFAGYVDSTDQGSEGSGEKDNPFHGSFEVSDDDFGFEKKKKVGKNDEEDVEDWADLSAMSPVEDRDMCQ